MTLDYKGLEFIQAQEGLRLNAYLDVAGVPTIGYGTTVYPCGLKVKLGEIVTQKQASDYFVNDVVKFESAIMMMVIEDKKISQNQFNALVSLCYNIGISNFAKSTLRRIVNSENYNRRDLVEPAFLSWNKIRKDGKLVPSDGLTNRRKAEVELYFS